MMVKQVNSKNTDAFQPITKNTSDVSACLEGRARHLDLWAATWLDDTALLMMHDRFSHILLCLCRWPNAFFIPDDNAGVMIETGYFDSIDLLDFIMTLEEIFDIKIDDELVQEMPPLGKSSYGVVLKWIDNICGTDKKLTDIENKWNAFSKCHPPFVFTWTDESLYWELRRTQITRPKTWTAQWADYDDDLIQLRDRVNRILVGELNWFDDSFIPQDHLEAVFHSCHGQEFAAGVLDKINYEFNSHIEFDYISSGQHTYADFLKKLWEKVRLNYRQVHPGQM